MRQAVPSTSTSEVTVQQTHPPLILRGAREDGAPETTTQLPPRGRLHWAADVVDNEFMGKKKSNCCCIYEKPKNFDESSSSSSSDSDGPKPKVYERQKKHKKRHQKYEHSTTCGDQINATSTVIEEHPAEEPDSQPTPRDSDLSPNSNPNPHI